MESIFSIRLAAMLSIAMIFLYTLWLIRSNRLSAHLAVSWIIVEIMLFAFTSIAKISTMLVIFLGERNFYSLVFLFIIGWIVLLMLDTLKRVSDVFDKSRILIQEIALLEEKVENLKKFVDQLREEKS